MNWTTSKCLIAGAAMGLSSLAHAEPTPGKDTADTAVKKSHDAVQMLDSRKTDAPASAAPAAPNPEQMNAWMSSMTPGEMHAWMAKGEGTWNATVKTMMPGEPQTEGTGSMTTTMILGGRYQHFMFKGEFMGQSFEGAGTLGYNNVTGKFESTWMDNMSTGTMYLSGGYDKATRTMTLTGDFLDPMTRKPITQKEVTVCPDDDHRVSTFFHKGADGKEIKVMEITYVRASAPAKDAAAIDPEAKERWDRKTREMNDKLKGAPGNN